ncbi:hypothetical protein BN1723_011626 [Verticillium longisporum]|uniref:Uncharacterized protein n=1 Tax=Verticillium longisporum TaxID=100787 RepID=A0A0G4LA31_VERLO|nr:hypothetical protein BN1723_011626 [Verticillium longisporum]
MSTEPDIRQLLAAAGVSSTYANNVADNCRTMNNVPDNSTHNELKDFNVNFNENPVLINVIHIPSESVNSRVPTDEHQSAPGRPLNADRPTSRQGAANQRQQEKTKKRVWCPWCKLPFVRRCGN